MLVPEKPNYTLLIDVGFGILMKPIPDEGDGYMMYTAFNTAVNAMKKELKEYSTGACSLWYTTSPHPLHGVDYHWEFSAVCEFEVTKSGIWEWSPRIEDLSTPKRWVQCRMETKKMHSNNYPSDECMIYTIQTLSFETDVIQIGYTDKDQNLSNVLAKRYKKLKDSLVVAKQFPKGIWNNPKQWATLGAHTVKSQPNIQNLAYTKELEMDANLVNMKNFSMAGNFMILPKATGIFKSSTTQQKPKDTTVSMPATTASKESETPKPSSHKIAEAIMAVKVFEESMSGGNTIYNAALAEVTKQKMVALAISQTALDQIVKTTTDNISVHSLLNFTEQWGNVK